MRPSHLPGPALSKSGIPGKREETDVFLIGTRASCSYATLDHPSRSLKKPIIIIIIIIGTHTIWCKKEGENSERRKVT